MLASWASAGAGVAASPAIERPLGVHVYRAWTEVDGLPGNRILALAQAHDGLLWLGTDEGLVRFDGVRFVRVNWPVTRKNYGAIEALASHSADSVWAARPEFA